MINRMILFLFALCAVAMLLVHGSDTRVPEKSISTEFASHWEPQLRQQCAVDQNKLLALVHPLRIKLAPQLTTLALTKEVKEVKAKPNIATKAEDKTALLKDVKNSGMITIVIDDMGVDHKRSARAINLPAGITLAFLPYANHVKEQVAKAKANGHEIFVHMPMQPESNTIDPGPNYLGVDQSLVEVRKRVQANLSAFDGYVGVNNHMGSKLTQDSLRLEIVMDELHSRHLMFLDSKTISDSLAEDVAHRFGVPATHRDVFLDHVETSKDVWKQLQKVEAIARRNGSVVAIGHPKDVTLTALEAWLPTLKEKGFTLVSAVELTQKRHVQKISQK